ncbi:MAG: biopolymer transporter TolR, partial [Opitutales bacterium]
MSPRILTFISIIAMSSLSAAAENHSLGLFAGQSSIGNPRLPGSAAFDAGSETYTITSAGANMWVGRDEFQMLWKKMSGDFILCARVSFPGKGVDPHRKMGWIIRTSLDEDSSYVDAAVHGDGLTCMQFRRSPGADTGSIDSTVTAPDVIQLSRRGDKCTLSAARFGEPFVSMESLDIALGEEVYV